MEKDVKNKKCGDKKCPVHGNVSVRGNVLKGVVVSDKMKNSVVVQIERIKHYPKYERHSGVHSKISAHKPECMDIHNKDVVEISETRKLSKTKSFVVTKKIGGNEK